MNKQPVKGLLFFRGEARTCVGYNVNKTNARLYSEGLGFLPTDFYVTFDNFITVGNCRLATRYRDDISVIFESWIDAKDFRIH
jgi:hypothetical protein